MVEHCETPAPGLKPVPPPATGIILRQSRRLYGGWPSTGLTATVGEKPLPDLGPRPPSPTGEGRFVARTRALKSALPSPRGRGGPRRALSPAGAGRVRGHFRQTNRTPEDVNSYCLPAEPGDLLRISAQFCNLALAQLRPTASVWSSTFVKRYPHPQTKGGCASQPSPLGEREV